MNDYKLIFDALKNVRRFSKENDLGILLEATRRAEELAELEIGNIDLNGSATVNDAILSSIFFFFFIFYKRSLSYAFTNFLPFNCPRDKFAILTLQIL